jgi:hypothetical protein
MAKNIPNGRKIGQMAKRYIKIFHCESVQKFPKLGFFGLKPSGNPGAIWQSSDGGVLHNCKNAASQPSVTVNPCKKASGVNVTILKIVSAKKTGDFDPKCSFVKYVCNFM